MVCPFWWSSLFGLLGVSNDWLCKDLCRSTLDGDNFLLLDGCFNRWRLREEWDVSSLPVVDDGVAHVVRVSLSALPELARTLGHLLDEVLGIGPCVDTEDVSDVLRGDSVKNGLDVVLGVWQSLGTHHSLEDLVDICFTLIVDNTWAIDQINALCEGDVLPHLGLTWDRGHLTALLLHQSIDHARFTDVGVADEAH